MSWKKVEGNPIESWSVLGSGTIITGRIGAIREIEGNFGPSAIVDIRNDIGIRRTFGCPAVLRDRLGNVPEGSPVRICYKGIMGRVHMFDVEVWDGDQRELVDETAPGDEASSDDVPF